jgi:hypothetical protein
MQPQHTEKVEPVAPQKPAETSTSATDTAQSTPPEVDYATDLFNMLSMDEPNENGSKASGATAADDFNWAGFQCMSVSLKKKKGKEKNTHYFSTIVFCLTFCFGRFGDTSINCVTWACLL